MDKTSFLTSRTLRFMPFFSSQHLNWLLSYLHIYSKWTYMSGIYNMNSYIPLKLLKKGHFCRFASRTSPTTLQKTPHNRPSPPITPLEFATNPPKSALPSFLCWYDASVGPLPAHDRNGKFTRIDHSLMTFSFWSFYHRSYPAPWACIALLSWYLLV